MVPIKVNNPEPHPAPGAGDMVMSRIVILEHDVDGLERMIKRLDEESTRCFKSGSKACANLNTRLGILERSVSSNEKDIRFLKESQAT